MSINSFSDVSLEIGGWIQPSVSRLTYWKETAFRWKLPKSAGWLALLSLVTMSAAALAVQWIPAPAKPIKLETKFEAAWVDTETVVAKKQDRVRLIEIVSAAPKPVVTERITPPDAPVVPPVLVVQDVDKPAPQHRRHHVEARSRDVCARHNMRKVMVGKYRWRCRR